MARLARTFASMLCAAGLMAGLGAMPAFAETIDAETLWQRGHEAAEKGSLVEAVGLYKQSLAVDPHGRAAMVDLATALMDLERWEDARQAYERAVRVYPDDAAALNGLGYVHYRQERFDTAISYFQRAIARTDDPQFHINLGLALLHQERYGQAEEQFRHTLTIDANHYWAMNNLGWTLQLEGRTDEALDAYAQALRMNPPGVATHLNAGALLLDEDAFEDAAWTYNDALKKDDTSAEAHGGLAIALEHTGRLQEARREAMLAIRLDPGYASGRVTYARILSKTGERDRAVTEMRKAIAMLGEKGGYLHYGMGQLLEERERYEEAIQSYRDYLKAEPEGPNVAAARMHLRLLLER